MDGKILLEKSVVCALMQKAKKWLSSTTMGRQKSIMTLSLGTVWKSNFVDFKEPVYMTKQYYL